MNFLLEVETYELLEICMLSRYVINFWSHETDSEIDEIKVLFLMHDNINEQSFGFNIETLSLRFS